MTFENPTLWWLIAGFLVIAELLSGTFYLLMLSIGAAAGALAAYAWADVTWQIVIASCVGGVAVVAWHYKQRHAPRLAAHTDSLDVGETVSVDAWDSQGTTSVKYRGAQWAALCASGATPEPGLHRIADVVGSRLVLEKI